MIRNLNKRHLFFLTSTLENSQCSTEGMEANEINLKMVLDFQVELNSKAWNRQCKSSIGYDCLYKMNTEIGIQEI